MTDRLFWHFLEATPGQSAPFCEWRRQLGAWAGFAGLQASFLQATGAHAASVVCASDCGAGCPRQVVETAPGEILAVCPEREAEPYRLARTDTLIWRLKHSALHRALGELLGLHGHSARVSACPGTWRLGDFVPEAGYVFPVFLHLPDPERDATDIVRSLCLRHHVFAVVFPTRTRLTAEAESLLGQRGAVFVPLAEEVRIGDDGQAMLVRPASEILKGLRACLPEPDSGGMVHFPTPAGAGWPDLSIRFVYGDSHSVSIRVGQTAKQYTCAQMGMASKRNGKPTKQWVVLQAFAESGGSIGWRDQQAHRKLEKQKQELCRRLQAFFRIEGEPIVWDSREKCYRCLFTIRPEGDGAGPEARRIQ